MRKLYLVLTCVFLFTLFPTTGFAEEAFDEGSWGDEDFYYSDDAYDYDEAEGYGYYDDEIEAASVSINTYFGWPVSAKSIYCLDCYPNGNNHTGIDMKAGPSYNVNAVADGKVVAVGNKCSHTDAGKSGTHNCYPKDDELRAYGQLGNFVAVEHTVDGNTYTSIYGHLTQNSIVVTKGATVTKGQKLGMGGSSGNSTGNHLHLTIYKGKFGTASSSLKSKTFQYYQNNPSVLSGMEFNYHVPVSSKLYGKWVEENCAVNSSSKWVYKGAGASGVAPTVSKTFTGSNGLHKYERYDCPHSWTWAESYCESKGGHLATIANASEQNDVLSVLSGCSKKIYYLGGSDAAAQKTWTWVTGEAFSYNNWDPDKPEPSNNSGEDYAAIMGKDVGSNKQRGEWIDIKNTGDPDYADYKLYNIGFVCEYDYVVFDANGGTGAPSPQQKVFKKDLTLSSAKPTRAGFTFLGWATSKTAAAAQYQAGGTYKNNTGVTLYAVWKGNVLSMQYNANGGMIGTNNYNFSLGADGTILRDGVTDIRKWNYGTSYNDGLIDDTTFGLAKDGYSFIGWCLNADGSTTVFDKNDTLNPETIYPNLKNADASITLYAIWMPTEAVTLRLPTGVKSIEAEAFSGVKAQAVIISENVERIADDAITDMIIIGIPGSTAETYAKDKGLRFISLSDYEPEYETPEDKED